MTSAKVTFFLAFALCPLPFALVSAQAPIVGRVLFNGLAVPGAVVMAMRGETPLSVVSDESGDFRFAALADGAWTIRVNMRGFVPISREVTLPLSEAGGAALTFTLSLQSFDEITAKELTDVSAADVLATAPPAAWSAAVPRTDDTPDIINGSVINGAASVFAQPRAFGNNRPRQSVLYTGGFTLGIGNSALNARPYSFAGAAAPAPNYSDVQAGFTLLGPLRIPWLLARGPNTSFAYQHGLQHSGTSQSALMPTTAERGGDFSSSGTAVRDPLTGQPFAGNVIPSNRISSQAAALLTYYPLPNSTTANGANYQVPVESTTTSDNVQIGMQQNLSMRTTAGATFAYQRNVTDAGTLFGFTDTTRQSTLTAGASWSRRFGRNTLLRGTYQYSRTATATTPFFANRVDVSAEAGIAGNSGAAADWGPPALSFPGIAGLRDADNQRSIKSMHAVNVEAQIKRGRHNLSIGGDIRPIRYDVASQPDPRGTLSFTGAASGSAFADFLLGIPSTSAIAFGNTDARLRGRSVDAYINDDFRIGAGVTVNAGIRWEYESPFTEAAGRLANLDVTSGFVAVSPVVADDPVGALTGTRYPSSLLRPDRRGFEPRIGLAWRPVLGSSLVIRATYGLYRNLGLYQSLGVLMAQQPPFTRSLSVQNTPQTPLTLANPFPSSLPATNTFGIDPGFRTGAVHSWTASAQRDLPGSLTVIAAYFGDRGTHLMQAFLPNTYPAGAVNPCASCPSGFVYVTSTGTSIRNAGQFTLRRRLYAGFTATVQYTIAKSTDDAATFANSVVKPTALSVAQNWLDLGAERGPSSFDQRHLLSVQAQYTTGVGVTGGTLVDGFWGTLYKDWTATAQLMAGSGLPLTPISFTAVSGTGIVGVRPSVTGVSASPVTSGSYVNPAAFTTPAPGTWGDAGRNSIRGPKQFSLDASLARVFRLRGRLNLEWRVVATNVLNRVTFAAINTVVTSPQFGLPIVANQMRRLQMTFRLRF